MGFIGIGTSDFKEFLDSDSFYVDKTLFIKEFIEKSFRVSLITRPRRFGKTMNMSMLKYFFDVKSDKNLFNELDISKEKELCKEHQNKYPVVYITFKDCKGKKWEDCSFLIKHAISLMYKEHLYLKDILSGTDLETYLLISENKAPDNEYKIALSNLIRYIFVNLNKKVVVLIDEYDTPIQDAYLNGEEYFEEAISFFRIFLSSALKDNIFIYKALMTGILRISKENMFSGLNNLKVSTLLNDEYADKFGFTDDEVKQLLSTKYNNILEIDEIRDWYNGYNIGKYQIYNPWSTCNAMDSGELKSYWMNTGSTELLFEIMEAMPLKYEKLLEELMKTGVARAKKISENTPLQDITTEERHLWTLLLFSGYLTKERKINEETFDLKVPNKEVSKIYNEFAKRLTKKYLGDVSEIQSSLYADDYSNFEKALNKKMQKVFSYNDRGKGKEYAYHTFMLGMLAMIERYEIVSNIEKKDGRCDIWMKDNITEEEYIWEFKVSKKERDMEKDCEEAMKQIDERYSTNKEEIKIGIAFYKKSAKIMVKKGDEILFFRPAVTNKTINTDKLST